ncbi:Heat-inducible transcription repressor HrcA [uncultured Candidatus Thioglobus sp.]|nr:Heat-inducible transcription repressor HrcA [uncultured Candidatus Thioglobus sp.]
MEKSTELSERSLMLFKSLVEHFIIDGQPVGSRSLVPDLDLSAATIRNIMADLEDIGLLRSPHTSSGRVPTVKGYRLFVDNLLCINELSEKEVQRITAHIDTEDSTENLLEKTSIVLSEITSLASVVMLPVTEQNTLDQIEFISLSNNRILVILVMRNGDIQNRLIHTERLFSAAELEQIANYLNETFSGMEFSDIRKNMLIELENMQRHVNQLMQSAVEMALQVIDIDTAKNHDYVLSGETNLMNVLEWNSMAHLKNLFDTFHQKRDILHLLEQSIHANGVQLFIGEESGYKVLDKCSVVTSPYTCNGQKFGVLGVIGPTRMDYERVIPVVDLTAKMLGLALNFK